MEIALFARQTLIGIRKKWVIVGFAVTGAVGSVCAAQQTLPDVYAVQYQSYVLENGLRVILHEDHRLPRVAVDICYQAGSMNEAPGQTGVAHLFEHLMFQGSKHIDAQGNGKNHMNILESAGATDINGVTDFDRVHFYETVPSNQLELAIWLESDRMGYLIDSLSREKLENQRDVVRNERRQAEGSPYYLAEEAVYHLLFPRSHPYYADVIGSHLDIESARMTTVRNFYQLYYKPNNASIAIAGDFDPGKVKSMISRYFGSIPTGSIAPSVIAKTPSVSSQRRITVTDAVQLPQMKVAWLTPKTFDPASYDLDSGLFAFGQSKASRLYQLLVYKEQVAQDVSCTNNSMQFTGIAECTVTAKKGIKLEEIEAAFWTELSTLQHVGPTDAELSAYKASSLTDKISALQQAEGVADMLNLYCHYTGDPGFLSKDIQMTKAVTVNSVKAALNRLTRSSSVVVYTIPGEKKTDDVPRGPADTDIDLKSADSGLPPISASQDWRNIMPQPGPQSILRLPVPKVFSLANGLRIYVIEDHSVPLLSTEIAVRAGSEYNRAGKGGLARLTGTLVTDGTTTRDLTALRQDADTIGTSISSSVGMNGATLTLRVLSDYATSAMELLSDVVKNPAFKQKDFDRRRNQQLLDIEQQRDSSVDIAFQEGLKLLFGNTPYGASESGTAGSMENLHLADVVDFYHEHFGPADAALIFAGDITTDRAEELAKRYFGLWSNVVSRTVTMPIPDEVKATRVVVIDRPNVPQTAVFAFGAGVAADSSLLPSLTIANYTLGGSFASRINMNLREKHGYTYGAESGFVCFRNAGYFFAGGAVRNDVAAQAAGELLRELRNFSKHPSDKEELDRAKLANIQSLPDRFATTSAAAQSAAAIFLSDELPDYYAKEAESYASATPYTVSEATRLGILSEHLIIVAVGDRAKIEQGLKHAGLGRVEVRDIDKKLR